MFEDITISFESLVTTGQLFIFWKFRKYVIKF